MNLFDFEIGEGEGEMKSKKRRRRSASSIRKRFGPCGNHSAANIFNFIPIHFRRSSDLPTCGYRLTPLIIKDHLVRAFCLPTSLASSTARTTTGYGLP